MRREASGLFVCLSSCAAGVSCGVPGTTNDRGVVQPAERSPLKREVLVQIQAPLPDTCHVAQRRPLLANRLALYRALPDLALELGDLPLPRLDEPLQVVARLLQRRRSVPGLGERALARDGVVTRRSRLADGRRASASRLGLTAQRGDGLSRLVRIDRGDRV